MTTPALGNALDDAVASFKKMKVERDGGVLVVRLYNPPKNLMDAPMVAELDRLADLARDQNRSSSSRPL